MKSFLCSVVLMGVVVLSVPTILGCNKRPQRLNPPPQAVVQVPPALIPGQSVCITDMAPPSRPERLGLGMDQAYEVPSGTYFSEVICRGEGSNVRRIDVLILAQDVPAFDAARTVGSSLVLRAHTPVNLARTFQIFVRQQ